MIAVESNNVTVVELLVGWLKMEHCPFFSGCFWLTNYHSTHLILTLHMCQLPVHALIHLSTYITYPLSWLPAVP